MVADEPSRILAVLLIACAALIFMRDEEAHPRDDVSRVIVRYTGVFIVIVLTPLIWLLGRLLTNGNIVEPVLYAIFPGVLLASFGLVSLYSPLKGRLKRLGIGGYAVLSALVVIAAASQPYTYSLPEVSLLSHKEPDEIKALMEVISENLSDEDEPSLMVPDETAARIAAYDTTYKLYREEEHIPTAFYVADPVKVTYYVEPAKNYGCTFIVVPASQDNEGYLIDLYKLKKAGGTKEYAVYRE